MWPPREWLWVQAVLLGLAAGVLYDLFRILRVRVRLPLLGPVLDLLFWLTLTVTLFLWSQWAWGGPVRLYGAAFLFLGGGGLLRAVQPLAALAGGTGWPTWITAILKILALRCLH